MALLIEADCAYNRVTLVTIVYILPNCVKPLFSFLENMVHNHNSVTSKTCLLFIFLDYKNIRINFAKKKFVIISQLIIYSLTSSHTQDKTILQSWTVLYLASSD